MDKQISFPIDFHGEKRKKLLSIYSRGDGALNTKKKLTHIGVILEPVMANLRPAKDLEMTRIWSLWRETLGETIANETRPAAFRDATLIVHVSSSVWLQHLTFSKQDIIKNLNSALQNELVNEIRFKIAAIHR